MPKDTRTIGSNYQYLPFPAPPASHKAACIDRTTALVRTNSSHIAHRWGWGQSYPSVGTPGDRLTKIGRVIHTRNPAPADHALRQCFKLFSALGITWRYSCQELWNRGNLEFYICV